MLPPSSFPDTDHKPISPLPIDSAITIDHNTQTVLFDCQRCGDPVMYRYQDYLFYCAILGPKIMNCGSCDLDVWWSRKQNEGQQ